jgi:hypothetical protein
MLASGQVVAKEVRGIQGRWGREKEVIILREPLFLIDKFEAFYASSARQSCARRYQF